MQVLRLRAVEFRDCLRRSCGLRFWVLFRDMVASDICPLTVLCPSESCKSQALAMREKEQEKEVVVV